MAETSLPRTESGRIQEPINQQVSGGFVSQRPAPVRAPQTPPAPQPAQPAQPQPAQAVVSETGGARFNIADIPESLRTPAMVDMMAIQQIQEKAGQNNKLLAQVDTLTKALANGTVSKEEQANLTPQQLRALQVSDMNSIARHIGMVKFTMSERGQALNNAINTLMVGMQNIRAEQRERRLDARQTIQDTLATVGPDAFMNLSEEEKRKIEKEAGLSVGYIDQARGRLAEQERQQREELERQRRIQDRQLAIQEEQFELQKIQDQQQAEMQRRQFELQERQFAFNQQESARDFQFKVQQASIDNRLRAVSARQAAAPKAIDYGKGYKLERVNETLSDGTYRKGLQFVSPTGAPVPAYEYFYAKNQQNESLAVGDMIATLKSSHNDDKNTARLIEEEIRARGEISDDFENTYWWLFRR